MRHLCKKNLVRLFQVKFIVLDKYCLYFTKQTVYHLSYFINVIIGIYYLLYILYKTRAVFIISAILFLLSINYELFTIPY